MVAFRHGIPSGLTRSKIKFNPWFVNEQSSRSRSAFMGPVDGRLFDAVFIEINDDVGAVCRPQREATSSEG